MIEPIQINKRIQEYLDFYHHDRIHESLSDLTPSVNIGYTINYNKSPRIRKYQKYQKNNRRKKDMSKLKEKLINLALTGITTQERSWKNALSRFFVGKVINLDAAELAHERRQKEQRRIQLEEKRRILLEEQRRIQRSIFDRLLTRDFSGPSEEEINLGSYLEQELRNWVELQGVKPDFPYRINPYYVKSSFMNEVLYLLPQDSTELKTPEERYNFSSIKRYVIQQRALADQEWSKMMNSENLPDYHNSDFINKHSKLLDEVRDNLLVSLEGFIESLVNSERFRGLNPEIIGKAAYNALFDCADYNLILKKDWFDIAYKFAYGDPYVPVSIELGDPIQADHAPDNGNNADRLSKIEKVLGFDAQFTFLQLIIRNSIVKILYDKVKIGQSSGDNLHDPYLSNFHGKESSYIAMIVYSALLSHGITKDQLIAIAREKANKNN